MKNSIKKLRLIILAITLISVNSCSKDDTPAPDPVTSLSSISPTSGPKATLVTINGTDLDKDVDNTSVFFNDKEATIQSISDTKIIAEVPTKAFTGTVKVVINGNELIGEEFTYIISDIQVSTFAGSTAGNQNGTVETAKFNSPMAIVFDKQGNGYVADFLNSIIRKITPQGIVSTFAGSTLGDSDGQGTNAKFSNPTDIVIDTQDNLYVADFTNHKIKKITPSGLVSTFAGSTGGFVDGQGTSAKFNNPIGLAIDAQQNIYVATFGHKIRKVTPNGTVSTIAGSSFGSEDGDVTNAKFKHPVALTLDAENNIYVSDFSNDRIRKITPSGVVSTLAGSMQGYADGQGTNAKFNRPRGITIDEEGNLYIAEQLNYKIRKITPSGLVSTIAGSTSVGYVDGEGSTAKFNAPLGITIDANRDLYVTEGSNHKIRKITQE